MDPFRHCHRNILGLWPRPLKLAYRLLVRLCRGASRTLKTAHPDSHTLSFLSCFRWPLSFLNSLDQVLDRLVSSSSKCYHSSTDDLSPGSLPGVLLLPNGTLLLEVGFTLRCLQRLSRPHFASLLCRWHDNSCTSDASTPVLSY